MSPFVGRDTYWRYWNSMRPLPSCGSQVGPVMSAPSFLHLYVCTPCCRSSTFQAKPQPMCASTSKVFLYGDVPLSPTKALNLFYYKPTLRCWKRTDGRQRLLLLLHTCLCINTTARVNERYFHLCHVISCIHISTQHIYTSIYIIWV